MKKRWWINNREMIDKNVQSDDKWEIENRKKVDIFILIFI